ncbi:hypothetical protein BDR06DRAFT_1009303 [Suillus hirtellus]|nr:hypothetical protein BDR06DRAFT_1009303 [Suillus hirtellus]
MLFPQTPSRSRLPGFSIDDTFPHLFLWQPMTFVDRLTDSFDKPSDRHSHDIRKNSTYSNRVLGVLGNIWPMMSSEIKTQAKDLMQDDPSIATNMGFRPPGGAYFPDADVFLDHVW